MLQTAFKSPLYETVSTTVSEVWNESCAVSELTNAIEHGTVILTIPSKWQKLFNNSRVTVKPRMQNAVDPAIIDELYARIPDFRKAYDEDGLTVAEFDTYGATVRTLRGFIASYHELIQVVCEELMLPNPDVPWAIDRWPTTVIGSW